MKLFLRKLCSLCFAVSIIAISVSAVGAEQSNAAQNNTSAADQLTLNGVNVDKGDLVTYTLYLSDVVDPVVGFELRLFYDETKLEYQKGSLHFDNFDVVIYNENIPGRIPMNSSQFSNPPDFREKKQFLSAKFKVLDAGVCDITYFFTDLYGEDMSYLTGTNFTFDLTSGDRFLIQNEESPYNTDAAVAASYSGDYANDGVYEVTKGSNQGLASGARPVVFIIAAVVVVLAVVSAVFFVMMKSRKG